MKLNVTNRRRSKLLPAIRRGSKLDPYLTTSGDDINDCTIRSDSIPQLLTLYSTEKASAILYIHLPHVLFSARVDFLYFVLVLFVVLPPPVEYLIMNPPHVAMNQDNS